MIGVDVVDADRRVANARLARAGIADLDFLVLQDFGTARGVNANCVGHGALLGSGPEDRPVIGFCFQPASNLNVAKPAAVSASEPARCATHGALPRRRSLRRAPGASAHDPVHPAAKRRVVVAGGSALAVGRFTWRLQRPSCQRAAASSSLARASTQRSPSGVALLLPERRARLQIVHHEPARVERLAAMRAGDDDEHDLVGGLELDRRDGRPVLRGCRIARAPRRRSLRAPFPSCPGNARASALTPSPRRSRRERCR